jgi:hypothetical protein
MGSRSVLSRCAAVSLCFPVGSIKDEGPGRLIGVRPRAFGAQRLLGKRMGGSFMPPLPGAVQCLGRGSIGAAATADLPALQLRALRCAGAHLRALRPRSDLLCRGVCAGAAARVTAPSGCALSADAARGVSARCSAKVVASAAPTRSDASGMCKRCSLGQRVGPFDRNHRAARCAAPRDAEEPARA